MSKTPIAMLVAAAALAGCGGGGGSNAVRSSIPPTSLSSAYSQTVWEDNFANDPTGAPDSGKWAMLTGNGAEYNSAGWGNNELEYYLPADATIAQGVLQIHGHANSSLAGLASPSPTCAGVVCAFSSARVTSTQPIDMSRPGFLEVKAEIPTGIGSWPAIWLLPGQTPGQNFPPSSAQLNLQPSWPSGGEIDMMEWLGRYLPPNKVQSTLHLPSGTAAPYQDNYIYKQILLSQPIDTGFHLYQLQWTQDRIDFAVDNTVAMSCYKASLSCTHPDGSAGLTLSSWPYGTSWQNYYLLMNLAIGGNLGAPNGDNTQVPANYDQTMQVAYVRYMTP